MPVPWTVQGNPQRVAIERDLKAGELSLDEIGQKYGLPKTTLWRYRKAFGLVPDKATPPLFQEGRADEAKRLIAAQSDAPANSKPIEITERMRRAYVRFCRSQCIRISVDPEKFQAGLLEWAQRFYREPSKERVRSSGPAWVGGERKKSMEFESGVRMQAIQRRAIDHTRNFENWMAGERDERDDPFYDWWNN